MLSRNSLLYLSVMGITSLLSRFTVNPERDPNHSINCKSGGIDVCGEEIYKSISSAYRERWCVVPLTAIGEILAICLMLIASGSMRMANRNGDGAALSGSPINLERWGSCLVGYDRGCGLSIYYLHPLPERRPKPKLF